MKKTLLLLTLILLTLNLSAPLPAAQQFPDFAAAQSTGEKNGYIAFFYPAGWDRHGEKLCRNLIANEAVLAAAGQSALLLVPIYQQRTRETNAECNKILGKLSQPGDMSDISYPAIAFYGMGAEMYATIHGEALMKASTAEIAAKIKQKLAARQKQDDILGQAHAATDPAEKNRLFMESARIDGLAWPRELLNTMKIVDPNDELGYIAAMHFNFHMWKNESLESFLQRLDKVLEDNKLSAGQKQRACAAAIGHIRRSIGTIAGGPLITKYAKAMHKLDPTSPLGLSGPVVMRDWVKQYRYGQGWSPDVIPGSEAPVLMQDVPIKKAGTYHVVFKLTDGRDALHVKSVRLMDGSQQVTEDTTPRSTTWSQTTQTFTLTTKKTVKNAALEITFSNDSEHRSTWGNITVNKQ